VNIEKIRDQILKQVDSGFSDEAEKNADAKRKDPEKDKSRLPFALDRDRILHSRAYKRYGGKTQVIFFPGMFNEHISSRHIHTTHVSQISRTIGRLINLNLDLLEAISLGHDLGHAPFGHDGEKFLSKLSVEFGGKQFHHNVQSMRILTSLLKNGEGINATIQVRDGVLCHNGEVHNTTLKPERGRTEEEVEKKAEKMREGDTSDVKPMTTEGCLMRICDTIAYIGQDIQDALVLNLIKLDEMPADCVAVLGKTNSEIVNSLVHDVVKNSIEGPGISFSEEISHYLLKLKKWNYEKIYLNPQIKTEIKKVEEGFRMLFEKYLNDIEKGNSESEIIKDREEKSEKYTKDTDNVTMVTDFISGMTDRYFLQCLNNRYIPKVWFG
jgi:dGTPase